MRRNPKATVGLAAILILAYKVLSLIAYAVARQHLQGLNGQTITSANAGHLFSVLLPLYGVVLLLTFLVSELLTGMLTAVIGRDVLGQRIDIAAAWRMAAPRLPAIIGAALLYVLVVISIWAGYAVLGIIALLAHAPTGLDVAYFVLFGIAAFCVTLWLVISYSLALPTVVLERQGPAQALARSWRLVRGNWWRVLGVTLLAGLIVFVAALVLEIPFTLIGNAAGGGSGVNVFVSTGNLSVAGVIIAGIGAVVAGALTRPIQAGVSVLLYVDLRMRKEGLDLALQTAARNELAQGDEFAVAWRPPPGM
jgi:hypothetical protein